MRRWCSKETNLLIYTHTIETLNWSEQAVDLEYLGYSLSVAMSEQCTIEIFKLIGLEESVKEKKYR